MKFNYYRGLPKELEREAFEALYPIFVKYAKMHKSHLYLNRISWIIQALVENISEDVRFSLDKSLTAP